MTEVTTADVVVAGAGHNSLITAAYLAAAGHEVVVLDVYVAREEADPAVARALVADAVPLPASQVHLPGSLDEAAEMVTGLARPGDLVLTLGAGDVTTVGPAVLDHLGAARD